MKKQAIVTGGTRGIGKEICRQLLAQDFDITFIGRDKASGAAIQEELQASFPDSSVTYLYGDLGTIASCKKLATDIQGQADKIDLLINNAGIWPTQLSTNSDGLEMAFMVNHLAPLILTKELLPNIQKAENSRIVNVNAGLYLKGKVSTEETPYGKDFHKIKTYCNTKLCNILATLEIADKLEGSGTTINALHPGVIKTGLGDFGGIMGLLLSLVKNFWKSPDQGAVAPVWLATAPELEGVNGKYYNEKKVEEISGQATEAEIRKDMWNKSLELADLSWN
ncbi:MAG: SDR family NAD(P)-dependent oxidoreductase [Bacteroidota bacterium]